MAWQNPTPTVDVVVVRPDPAAVLLISRRNPPLGWALPGGFVDVGERVESAAVREVLEETGLSVTLEALLHVYSDPARDPRKHTLSVVFVGQATADAQPQAGDDAAATRWVSVSALEAWVEGGGPGPDGLPLAFDHAEILRDWLRYRRDGRRPALMPEKRPPAPKS